MAKRYYDTGNPACMHSKKDCNQRDENGLCKALSDTRFDGDCPFYCSRKVREGYKIEATTYEPKPGKE